MPRSPSTGIFTRVSNTFSEPITGTVIDPTDAIELFNDYDSGLTFDDGEPLILIGSTSGVLTIKAPDTASGTLTLPAGTTDFQATGGAGQFVRQDSAGGPFTVTTVPASSISSGAALTRVDDTNVTATLGGSPSTALLAATSITLGWTGTLAAARGGFGADVSAQTGIALNTAGTFSWLSSSGTGNVARVNSPTFVTPNLGTPSAVTLTNATGLPVATGISGLGTGVATALGVNVGSAGAVVVNGGALGTPSSGTLTNTTGFPIANLAGAGTGVLTALAINTGSVGAVLVNGGALGTPSSGTLTNATGLPLLGLASQAAYTIVGNFTGSSASPTATAIGSLTNKSSPTSADILLIQDVAASNALKYSTLGQAIAAVSSGVTTLNGDDGAITTDLNALQNASLSVSAAGSALTIALKDASGSDPSAGSPVAVNFRSATGTTGTVSTLQVTAATSLVISSGSTMGVTSSTAFRLWVVLFNDAGTARLGAINCSAANNVYPLNDGALASSTAEGGAGAADSAGVFYTGTAVASKPYRILGYLEWSSSGLTAGTWTTTNLLQIQSFGVGVRKPGDTVQVVYGSTGSTTTRSSSTLAASANSASITPASAANLVRVTATGSALIATSSNVFNSILSRGATNFGTPQQMTAAVGNQRFPVIHDGMDSPNTTSSTTYSVYIASNDNATNVLYPSNAITSPQGTIILTEIQG